MEQDVRTCPGCGAAAPDRSACPYCSWLPDLSEGPNLDAIEAVGRPPAADLQGESQAQTNEIGDMSVEAAQEALPGGEIVIESLPEREEKIEVMVRPRPRRPLERLRYGSASS